MPASLICRRFRSRWHQRPRLDVPVGNSDGHREATPGPGDRRRRAQQIFGGHGQGRPDHRGVGRHRSGLRRPSAPGGVGRRRIESTRDVLGAWPGLVIDVDIDDSVRDGVSEVLARHGRIDAVVASAGWGVAGAVEHTTIDEAKAQVETNFWGATRVVQAVLPGHAGPGRGPDRPHQLDRRASSPSPSRLSTAPASSPSRDWGRPWLTRWRPLGST